MVTARWSSGIQGTAEQQNKNNNEKRRANEGEEGDRMTLVGSCVT